MRTLGGERVMSESPIIVNPITPADTPAWIAMRQSLGPDWFSHRIEEEAARYFKTGLIDHLRHVVLAAREEPGGAPLGFAEVSLRD